MLRSYKMIDTLVIESYAHYVHLATAAEIALSESSQGKNVGFVFLHSNNPDNPFFSDDPLRKILYLVKPVSCRNLVLKIEKKLLQAGVKIWKENPLDSKLLKEIKQFSVGFPDNLEDLKKYNYKGAKLGLAAASSLISHSRKTSPDIRYYHRLVQSYLYASASTFEKSKDVLTKIMPQKIISFNGRFACCKAIFEAASHLNIQLQYHERGATFDKYEVFDQIPHDFSYTQEKITLFWTHSQLSFEEKTQQAHDFFKLKKEGNGIGWHSFVDKQEKGLVPQETKKRKVVYFSSSDDEFAAIDSFPMEGSIFDNQIHAVNTLISWVSKQQDSILVIRLHPHLKEKHPSDRNLWCSLSGENVILIPPESPTDSYALIDWSDIVVTYGSTMGVESTYWGRPSILLKEQTTYTGFGCVYEPRSIDELFRLLSATNLTALEQEKCLPYGFYFMSYGRSYKYYTPENLFTGKFLGEKLTYYPEWIDMLHKLKLAIQRSTNSLLTST
jgi:hypothetical protein